jgi:hypothetical protein
MNKVYDRVSWYGKAGTLAVAPDQAAGFEQYQSPTKRDAFLATMEKGQDKNP